MPLFLQNHDLVNPCLRSEKNLFQKIYKKNESNRSNYHAFVIPIPNDIDGRTFAFFFVVIC